MPLVAASGCKSRPAARNESGSSDAPSNGSTAIDFSRSFLYCRPSGTKIHVRPQIECHCVARDRESGTTDEYVLGVVAKTGLKPDSSDRGQAPGYDYWIIFSKEHIYTRRTHTSSYFNNPTTLTVDEFGASSWHVERSPATRLASGGDVRRAVETWRPLVARTVFTDSERAVDVTVEYPVKWVDFNLETDEFRVETGPVVLLWPESVRVGRPAAFDDFRWAHLDYHSLERVRCLLDVPTSILTGATFSPPAEHGRGGRASRALLAKDVERIERRLYDWPSAPVPAPTLRALLSTDHYSIAIEREAATEVYAL